MHFENSCSSFFAAGVEQPETKISKEPSAMEIAAALKSKQKQTNSSPVS